jgi:hypothetical protein
MLLKLTNESLNDDPGLGWATGLQSEIEGTGAEGVEGRVEGLQILDWSWTLGPFDAIISARVPSEVQAAELATILAKKARASTTTLTALTAEEMDSVLQVMGIHNGRFVVEGT